MKTNILILTISIIITLGLSGCMMKRMFSDNSGSKMGMMSKIENITIRDEEAL